MSDPDIDRSLIRVSVGVEDLNDLIQDLASAMILAGQELS